MAKTPVRKSKPVAPGKSTAPKGARKRRAKLEPITGTAQDVYRYVLNNIAFENYRDCCTVDDIAEHFGKTPGRLRPALRKLLDAGYITTSGNIVESVYPTVEALRRQDPRLSEADAEKLLRKLRRS